MSDLVERVREIVAGDCGGLGEAACRAGCECRDRAVAVIELTRKEATTRIEQLEAENARLRDILLKTRAIVVDGSMTGFNVLDGDWADRLYANNGTISAALAGKAVIAPAEKTGMDEILREQAARDVFPRPSRRAMAEAPKKTGE